MNLAELKGQNIALIVWNTEKEDDVHVYLGKLQEDKEEHYFVNKEKGWTVLLNEKQLGRLKPVSDDVKKILLNADYAISLSIGDLQQPNKATGMKWHD